MKIPTLTRSRLSVSSRLMKQALNGSMQRPIILSSTTRRPFMPAKWREWPSSFIRIYLMIWGGGIIDRVNGRSHIFIFKDKKNWQAFRRKIVLASEWADSFVESTVMYLQQKPDNAESAAIFAHEMTHIIFNRFFKKRPALWLNEGLAEWYRNFAYAAFKGTKKGKRAVFSKKYYSCSVENLINARVYGQSSTAVEGFYENAKWFTAFLRMNWPDAKFSAFLKDCMETGRTKKMLFKHYGASIEKLEEGFNDFVRKRAKNR